MKSLKSALSLASRACLRPQAALRIGESKEQLRFASWLASLLVCSTLFAHADGIQDQPAITIERGRCEDCPAYDLLIYSNGRFLYKGKGNVTVTGEQASWISVEEVDELVSELERLNFFSVSDRRSDDTDRVYSEYQCSNYLNDKLEGRRPPEECKRDTNATARRVLTLRGRHRTGDIISLRVGTRSKSLVLDDVHVTQAKDISCVIQHILSATHVSKWAGDRKPSSTRRE